jgi:hypothetical protein
VRVTHLQFDRATSSPGGGASSTSRQSSINVIVNTLVTASCDRHILWTIVEHACTLLLSQASVHLVSPTVGARDKTVLRHELAAELVSACAYSHTSHLQTPVLSRLHRLCGGGSPAAAVSKRRSRDDQSMSMSQSRPTASPSNGKRECSSMCSFIFTYTHRRRQPFAISRGSSAAAHVGE